jgi:site-specific recombinase XerD
VGWQRAALQPPGERNHSTTVIAVVQKSGLRSQVALVVKNAAEQAGLDPAKYSGHSLRAGSATTAAARGASERAIARKTGHALNSAVLRSYIRHASVFTDIAVSVLGL